MKTRKHQIILDALEESGRVTLAEAVELIGGDIHANKSFHVGNVLGNMVKRGMIQRGKPGVFLPVAQLEMKGFSLE